MIWIVLISFLLEGVISNFVNMNGYLLPLFTLVSLIMICPLFEESSKYYMYAFFIGLAYDLFYMETIVFNAIIFCFMAVIIRRLNIVLSDNFINILITVALSIIFYRIIVYGLLVFVGIVSFDLMALIFSILKSLILNLVYSMILFLVMKRLFKKKKFY